MPLLQVRDNKQLYGHCLYLRMFDNLFLLVQLQRDTDMDVLGPYPSSHAEGFDVLISDVKPEDLPGRISQALGVQYLTEMQSIDWGVCQRHRLQYQK